MCLHVFKREIETARESARRVNSPREVLELKMVSARARAAL